MSAMLAPTQTFYVLEEPEQVWSVSGGSFNGLSRVQHVQAPSQQIQYALDLLLDVFDSLSCQSTDCDNGVGFYLDEREDETAREGFHLTVIVDDGDDVFLCCESCAPLAVAQPVS